MLNPADGLKVALRREEEATENSPYHQGGETIRGTVFKAVKQTHVLPRRQGQQHQNQGKKPPPTSEEQKQNRGQHHRSTQKALR